MCYVCDVRDPDCNVMNGKKIQPTACPSEKCVISGIIAKFIARNYHLTLHPPIIEYHCDSTMPISDDCQAEYDNAVQNGQLDDFYYRCATETGEQPLRTRCPLCCGNNTKSINERGEYECEADSSFDEVAKRCEDKQSCQVPASSELFGDPCEGIHKYLEVDYKCIEPGPSSKKVITCEREEMRHVN